MTRWRRAVAITALFALAAPCLRAQGSRITPEARLDAIIQPHETRDILVRLLGYVARPMPPARFHMGVVQT